VSPRVNRILPAIQPILPELQSTPFDHRDWVFEPKYDGFRGLLHITRTGAAFTSKRGLPLKRFDQLAREVRDQLRVRDAILDGEVLAIDPEGHARFLLLMRGAGNLHYAAFDLLWLNGRDLRAKPLSERKCRLEQLIPEARPGLSRVLTVPEQGRALFEAVQRLDLEGIVAKRKADPYRPGTTWVKIKNNSATLARHGGEWGGGGTPAPAVGPDHRPSRSAGYHLGMAAYRPRGGAAAACCSGELHGCCPDRGSRL
jgi:ATP-dependent DNA ligase